MKNILIFIGGATIGSVVTWKLIEKHYKDLADEEIASVIDTFKRKYERTPEENASKTVRDSYSDEVQIPGEIDKINYSNISKKEGYKGDDKENENTNFSINEKVEEIPEDYIVPYIIRPEDFGSKLDYGTKSLTLYSDDVITDEVDNPYDPDKLIGTGVTKLIFDNIGEYEDDAIHIRDEYNEMDYEILKDERPFGEVTKG